MKSFSKQPSEVLDYDIDASDWLTQGDNVTGASVVISPVSGLALDNTVISDDRVKIWLSGGVDKSNYKVTTIISTEDGRSKEIDFEIRVIYL